MLNLSVIIPTRNADEDLLARAIESAHNLGAEVCVWLDHTDEEAWVFYHYERVCRFDIPNGALIDSGRCGQVGAMNGALGMATRDYIIFYGDDDWLGVGAVELVEYLENNPSVAFAYGSQQYHGQRVDLVKPRQYTGDELYLSNIPLNGIVYRRDVVNALGGWQTTHTIEGAGHCEDYDLLLRVHEAGYVGVAVNTQNPVLHYTLALGRGWATMQAHADEINEAFKRKHPKFIGRL